jgi:hypothetical protein
MKKPYPATLWFALLTCLVLGGVTTVAYLGLKPTGEGIDNGQIITAFGIAAWATGPVMAVLSFILICIVNVIRRIIRLRWNKWATVVTLFAGTVPWAVFGWAITGEPRYTAFAIAAIEYIGRPMLWGGVVATLFVIVLSLPVMFSSSTKKKK